MPFQSFKSKTLKMQQLMAAAAAAAAAKPATQVEKFRNKGAVTCLSYRLETPCEHTTNIHIGGFGFCQ